MVSAAMVNGCIHMLFGGLAVLNAPFTAVNAIRNRAQGDIGVTDAWFAPDGDHLLVTRESGRYQYLYRISIDTNEQLQLTQGEQFDFAPSYSADGSKIVFSSAIKKKGRRLKKSDLYVMNSDGTELERIATGARMLYNPSFSSDGSHVIFNSAYSVYIVSLDTKESKLLTSSDGAYTHVEFLEGDKQIFYWRAKWYGHTSPIAASKWHDYTSYTMSVDEGIETPFIEREYYSLDSYLLAPNKKWMLTGTTWFRQHVISMENPSNITPLQVEGQEYTYLKDQERLSRSLHYPRFSPDSKSIVFTMTLWPEQDISTDVLMEIHIMDFRTRQARQVTHLNRRIIVPKLSPDSERVVFLVDPKPRQDWNALELWIVNSDGTDAHRIDVPVKP